MSDWARIVYREFYDVPRIFLAKYASRTFLFDGLYDPTIEEYPDDYTVYLMPDLSEEELRGDWTNFHARSEKALGKVSVSKVVFDETRRMAIDTGVLDILLDQTKRSG